MMQKLVNTILERKKNTKELNKEHTQEMLEFKEDIKYIFKGIWEK